MKTFAEKLQAVSGQLDEVESLVLLVEGQRAFLDAYLTLSKMSVGEEVEVHYDPDELWSEFSFLEGAVIYHARNYIELARRLIESLRLFPLEADTAQCSVDKGIANGISYEFDSFVVAFYRVMEEPSILDVENAARHNDKIPESKAIRRKRDKTNVESLYWRVVLLRIQAAHSMDARYSKSDDRAGRFLRICSKADVLDITSDLCRLPANTIIDLKSDQKVKALIQREKIDKDSEAPLFDILFPGKSPTGKGKKKPVALLPIGFERFDLLNGFCELIYEAGEYLEGINRVFYAGMGDHESMSTDQVLTYGQDAKGRTLTTTRKVFSESARPNRKED